MEKLHLLILVLVAMLLGLTLLYICEILWLRPERIRRKLRKQGVRGPKPSLLHGNTQEIKRIRQELATDEQKQADTNNYMPKLFPHLLLWRETYGPVFLYSTGAMEVLYVADPAMIKDMSHCTSMQFGRPTHVKRSRKPLFGDSILVANGDLWAYQRKIIAPEFFMEKIKVMIWIIVDASVPLLEAWESMLDNAGGSREIYVDDPLRNFSADVIAKTCFGSDFVTAEEIFRKLRQLQMAISKQDALWKHLPTKSNQEIQKLEREVRLLILDVANRERNSNNDDDDSRHNDLLRTIVDGARHCLGYPGWGRTAEENFIVDNCKSIYFAGHETTSVTATWCLMLLATHRTWQDRARAEALEVCHGRKTLLDADTLRRLKTITMVIQETLRLYPPSSMMYREALVDVKLGGLDVPRGTIVQAARLMLHLDEAAWGPDAGEFRPDRFADGAAAACRPAMAQMYMPFGHGPRVCAGQNLALMELKVLLAKLLSRFDFSPSPAYRHAPAFRLTIEPGFGMPLLVTRLP